MNVLLLTKTTLWCDAAANFARLLFPQASIVRAERGTPLPPEVLKWRGDCLISFLSSWVIPAQVLKSAKVAALNFHPGPPQYPGTGCYNFALYDEAAEYGVTCHHMAPQVDAGRIVQVTRFPILENDSVATLKERSMVYLLDLFYQIIGKVSQGSSLPESQECWARAPYVRRELEALCCITPHMPEKEIKRRLRATYYPGFPGPYMELAGAKFTAGGAHV